MERTKTLIQHIATLIVARSNCKASGNTEWFDRNTERLEMLRREFLPSGSGIDSGTTIDLDASNDTRIVFNTSFHHMNDGGMYDGWTEHRIVVTPEFDGVSIAIGGRDRNQIKEYLGDTFHHALGLRITEDAEGYRLAA